MAPAQAPTTPSLAPRPPPTPYGSLSPRPSSSSHTPSQSKLARPLSFSLFSPPSSSSAETTSSQPVAPSPAGRRPSLESSSSSSSFTFQTPQTPLAAAARPSSSHSSRPASFAARRLSFASSSSEARDPSVYQSYLQKKDFKGRVNWAANLAFAGKTYVSEPRAVQVTRAAPRQITIGAHSRDSSLGSVYSTASAPSPRVSLTSSGLTPATVSPSVEKPFARKRRNISDPAAVLPPLPEIVDPDTTAGTILQTTSAPVAVVEPVEPVVRVASAPVAAPVASPVAAQEETPAPATAPVAIVEESKAVRDENTPEPLRTAKAAVDSDSSIGAVEPRLEATPREQEAEVEAQVQEQEQVAAVEEPAPAPVVLSTPPEPLVLSPPPRKMGLLRNLTKRTKRDAAPASTTPSVRPKISLPINLISTTYKGLSDTVDVASAQAASPSTVSPTSLSHSVHSSSDETDASGSTEPTLTDGSSVSSSPPRSPVDRKDFDAKDFAAYYSPATDKHDFAAEPAIADADADAPVAPPAIPKRAASHTRSEHIRLSRARSMRHSTLDADAPPPSLVDALIQQERQRDLEQQQKREQASPSAQYVHPFHAELEQLDEVAEEFLAAASAATAAEDDEVMDARGLVKWDVNDYLTEIIDVADDAAHAYADSPAVLRHDVALMWA